MRLEISDRLMNTIMMALGELPYRVAAPALAELHNALNIARGAMGSGNGGGKVRASNGGSVMSQYEGEDNAGDAGSVREP